MMTFKELGIDRDIVLALDELGFEHPMPVQEKVIPLLLGPPADIVALAHTGTGKTAAFGLPLIQTAHGDDPLPHALILCPTRELCLQITHDLEDYARYTEDLRILPVYGGSSMEIQIKALKKGVQIVVATPGRLLDLIRRRAVKLRRIETVVLDEADEMLNMGFSESINDILAEVPENRNTLLFSATMPDEVARIARNYMKSPVEITIGNRNSGAENIKHLYYTVHAKDKYTALKRIVDYFPLIYGIIFCRTRIDTQEIADKLIADGYNAEALHGDLSQSQRDSVMQKFRIRHLQLLVATDVAARGLDVDDLTHIINYSLPDDLSAYTHRSGRTGRAGKAGTSIAIINLKEKHLIRQIEKMINKSFLVVKIPQGKEICEKQLFNLIHKMENVELENAEIDPYLPTIYRKLEWLDKEEVIKRFVALEFNRFLDYYRNAKDINVKEEPQSGSGNQQKERKRAGEKQGKNAAHFTLLSINAGKADGLYPGVLMELINNNSPGKRIRIGEITLEKHSCTFEVEHKFSGYLQEVIQDSEFNGKNMVVKQIGNQPASTDLSNFPSRPKREGRKNPFHKENHESNRKKGFSGKKSLHGKSKK